MNSLGNLTDILRVAGTREVSKFTLLNHRQIKVDFFSDYPADRKLHTLGITGFPSVSAADPDVDALKPSPNGLTKMLRLLQVAPGNCLCIGDRDERDEECARRSGFRSLLKSRDECPGDVFVSYWQLIGSLDYRERRTN